MSYYTENSGWTEQQAVEHIEKLFEDGTVEALKMLRTAAAAQNTVLRSLFSCVLSANFAVLVWTFPLFSGLIVLPKTKETTPP